MPQTRAYPLTITSDGPTSCPITTTHSTPACPGNFGFGWDWRSRDAAIRYQLSTRPDTAPESTTFKPSITQPITAYSPTRRWNRKRRRYEPYIYPIFDFSTSHQIVFFLPLRACSIFRVIDEYILRKAIDSKVKKVWEAEKDNSASLWKPLVLGLS